MLILLSALVSAQSSDIRINLRPIDFEEEINSLPVNYELHSITLDQTIEGNAIIAEKGFTLSTFEGINELYITVDDSKTPGPDFYGKASFITNDLTSVMTPLFSIASTTIKVTDKKNIPLPNIPVRVDCSKDYATQGYFVTDEFGIVKIEQLPADNCTFRAAHEEHITSLELVVERGSNDEIILKLDFKSQKNYFGTTAIIIIIILLALLLWKQKPKYVDEDEAEEQEDEPSSRKEDIISALNQREQEVVRFILKQNKDYVSQANVVHGTGIAKTSLVRILSSLEQKKIIQIESVGKLKKISLTEEFGSK